MEHPNEMGKREYSFLKERSWKRCHKKKVYRPDIPKLDISNYPYLKKIYCARCGERLVRYVSKGDKVFWICNGQKRKGSVFCKGIRVPDEEIKKMEFDTEKIILWKG
ncbi:MAG: zinc ribbon domain-containing protein [Acetatifactor sp.]|nr:zinc ribbon domain-containing protein [Acetatifactor sp.]